MNFSVFVLSNEMMVLQSFKHLHLGIVLSSNLHEINMLNMWYLKWKRDYSILTFNAVR